MAPPIGPIPYSSVVGGGIDREFRPLASKAELGAAVDGGAKAAPDTGIRSSSAEIFEAAPLCIIGFFFGADCSLETTPANNPAAICILRDCSASASSSRCGGGASPGGSGVGPPMPVTKLGRMPGGLVLLCILFAGTDEWANLGGGAEKSSPVGAAS